MTYPLDELAHEGISGDIEQLGERRHAVGQIEPAEPIELLLDAFQVQHHELLVRQIAQRRQALLI